MKTLILCLLSLSVLGCGTSSTGVCNICPTAKSVTTAGCATQGTKSKCKSAVIKSVTDTSCAAGKPATTHDACVFEDCGEDFDCSPIVQY